VRDQNTEILQLALARDGHRHGVGGRGGLEADREKHHLVLRVLGCDLHRVERRVHDPHVATARAALE
jgi:hypothetical protein